MDTAGSLRRRPAPGQGQRPGQPRPVRAVGKKSQTSGGCRGRVPMPKPMGSPWMRGQGSRSRPAPPPGEPGRTQSHVSRLPPCPEPPARGAGTGRAPGRVIHGCQPPSGGSPPEAMTGFPFGAKPPGPNLVILQTKVQKGGEGGDFPPLLIGGDNSHGIDAIRIQTTEYILSAIAI